MKLHTNRHSLEQVALHLVDPTLKTKITNRNSIIFPLPLYHKVLQGALCPDAEFVGLGRSEQEILEEHISQMKQISCNF